MLDSPFRYLNPMYIEVEPQQKEITKISFKELELHYSVQKDESLTNDLVSVVKIKTANPAPDIYGNSCPLLPGDLAFADNCVFHEIWHDDPHMAKALGNVIRKSHIVAYERDGRIYSYPKIKSIYTITRTNGMEDVPQEQIQTTGLIKYRPGYYLAKRRDDVLYKYFLPEKASFLAEGVPVNIEPVRGMLCVYEIINEEAKGRLFLTHKDFAIPYRLDMADLKDKGQETILGNAEVFGLEIDMLEAELIL